MEITTNQLIALTAFSKQELQWLISDGGYTVKGDEPVDPDDRRLIYMTGKGGLIEQVEAFRNMKEIVTEQIERELKKNNDINHSIH